MIRVLLTAAVVLACTEVRAQVDIWAINQGIQNQYNSAYYYQRPYYYAPPVYYAPPSYGYYRPYSSFQSQQDSWQVQREIRLLRWAVEDAERARRWER